MSHSHGIPESYVPAEALQCSRYTFAMTLPPRQLIQCTSSAWSHAHPSSSWTSSSHDSNRTPHSGCTHQWPGPQSGREWLTTPWVDTAVSCWTLEYAVHLSLWTVTVVPLLKCCCMIGSNVRADMSGTILMTPRQETGLCRNRGSSFCTTDPGPPSIDGASWLRRCQLHVYMYVSEVLVHLYSSLLHFRFLSSICHRVLPGPPVHQHHPLLQGQLGLGKEGAIP